MTFFTGQAVVTNKDKVAQQSSALRHATELTSIVRTLYGTSGRSAAKPIVVVVRDGGPDHCVPFGSVKVANLCLFQALDLDMLVCTYLSIPDLAKPSRKSYVHTKLCSTKCFSCPFKNASFL